ncbi:hypothetical protein GCM10010531_38640 [Blastococcus jejuensis]|uniref:Alpha/beta hydrolase family protein n=1 Tax=Blastococcus jejuensis TaxID=351224 RepID=A0ABP6PJU7_9ACTN
MRRSLVLVAAVLLSGCGGGTTAEPASPAEDGALTVRTLDLRDGSRTTDPTPATPGKDAAPGRDLPTTIAYPPEGDDLPVVVFTHGLGSQPEAYEELLTEWARAGFLVVAPRYPLTSQGSAEVFDDVREQPADISFVLTAVLALDDTAGDDLEGRIDGEHVAAGGHSAGAITTLGLLGPCCTDERIDAAVILAGAPLYFGSAFAPPGVPALFVHGTDDTVLPVGDAQTMFSAYPGPAAFLELVGGTHSAPFDEASDPAYEAVAAATTDFLRWSLAGDEAALDDLRAVPQRWPGVQLTADRLAGG